jgi:hypothetical protein
VGRKKYKFRPPTLETGRRGNDDFREVWASRLWGNIDKDEYYRMVGGVLNWDNIMARKTYRLELKIDFRDDASHEVMRSIAKQYARDLMASAMLLEDKSKPLVALFTDDTFEGQEKIEFMDPSEELHTP